MDNSPELVAKRNQLKRELVTGKDKTFAALVFFKAGRVVEILARTHQPVPWFYGAIIISLILLLAIPLALAPLDKTNQRVIFQELLGVGSLYQGLLGAILATILMDKAFADIRTHVVDAIISIDDLNNLQEWLADAWSVRKSRLFVVLISVGWCLFVTLGKSMTLGGFAGSMQVVGAFLYGFFVAIPIYYVWMMLRLPARISRYRYHLYDFDPANSDIIRYLAQILNRTSFFLAAFTAVGTLIVGLQGAWWMSVGLVGAGWIPVLVLFFSTQMALSNIVATAKWKTLGELQAEINQLRTGADLANKETVEAITRLMDLHERIAATRNSAFNMQTGLGVLKDLLLPVLASILANYEQLRKLLS
jgi:hypothetical protein